MTFAIHVQGGTGAGTKLPPREHKPWTCDCTVTLLNRSDRGFVGELVRGGTFEVAKGETIGHRLHRGTRYSCPDCGTRRPR